MAQQLVGAFPAEAMVAEATPTPPRTSTEVYEALRGNCADGGDGVEPLRALLGRAADKSDPVAGGDGTHFSEVGLRAALPFVDAIVSKLQAQLVVSDSTLCPVGSGWRDKWSAIARSGLAVPARPAWGCSFGGSWNSFRWAVEAAVEEFGECDRILVLIAGNDCKPQSDAAQIHGEMKSLAALWAAKGTEILYVEVVPPADQQVPLWDWNEGETASGEDARTS